MKLRRAQVLWMFAVTATLYAYASTFWLIRTRTTTRDCGGDVIFFPKGAVRTFYRPLIVADKSLNFPVLYEGEPDEKAYYEFDNYRCE